MLVGLRTNDLERVVHQRVLCGEWISAARGGENIM